jgi:hypothetical protein
VWKRGGGYEEFEDTKGVIRIRISKNRQHKEKVQKDKQRSTKHTHKIKDRVPLIPLKSGSERMCSGRVRSSCSTSDTRRVNHVTIPSNQNYVFMQNKNQMISFFLQLVQKCLIEDCRIRLIIFVSFMWVCFHKIWRHYFVLKKTIAEHGRSLASTNTV